LYESGSQSHHFHTRSLGIPPATAFGSTVYGAQFEDGYGRGRFGNVNFVTGLFYPPSRSR